VTGAIEKNTKKEKDKKPYYGKLGIHPDHLVVLEMWGLKYALFLCFGHWLIQQFVLLYKP